MPRLRLAHVSDPHLGPLPSVRLRELASKRLTGFLNYRGSRADIHDMGLLARLMADVAAQAPDHVCCTGDIANIGLVAEFEAGARFLTRLGPPDAVTFVPGNHDVYVRGAMAPMIRHLGPWMTGDGDPGCRFPFVRRRGDVALVGLSSAVPTLPFMASGTLGKAQRAALRGTLVALGREGLARIILIHHPPHRGGARPGRGLTDAPAFEDILAAAGAELVLHGHNHVASLICRPSPDGHVPILGAPSASAMAGTAGHRAGYHLVTIETEPGRRPAISVTTRGLLPDGTIGETGRFGVSPQGVPFPPPAAPAAPPGPEPR